MKNVGFKKLFALLMVLLLGADVFAQSKEQTRVEDAATVLTDLRQMKEGIPHQLLEISEGIIIIPRMINASFVVGGKRGRGIALIKRADGKWSDPVFITLTGGSFGFQLGVQAVDLVLVFKHRKSLVEIGDGSFTLGGDISVAAGPVGRSSTASTDYKLQAEVYSYSRSKGFFAGLSLSGASLSVDDKAISSFYGKSVGAAYIFQKSDFESQAIKNLQQTLKGLYQ